jgi:hypothetical protein
MLSNHILTRSSDGRRGKRRKTREGVDVDVSAADGAEVGPTMLRNGMAFGDNMS